MPAVLLFLFSFLCFYVAFRAKSLKKEIAEKGFSRRQMLIGNINLAVGDGKYAFSYNYDRAIYLNESEDVVVIAWWKGDTVHREYIQPQDIMSIKLGESAIARLENRTAPPNSLPKTMVLIKRTAGQKDTGIILADEDVAKEWYWRVQNVAAKFDAGAGTMECRL